MSLNQTLLWIDSEAARRSQAARAAYRKQMRALRADYDRRQRALAAEEAEELKRTERWRVTVLATLEDRPVPLAEVRSVRRAVTADLPASPRGKSAEAG